MQAVRAGGSGSAGEGTWWLEYRPDWEKESSPWEAIMQATAPVAVFTWPSCDRKSAGPMKPICASKCHLCAAPFQNALIAMQLLGMQHTADMSYSHLSRHSPGSSPNQGLTGL